MTNQEQFEQFVRETRGHFGDSLELKHADGSYMLAAFERDWQLWQEADKRRFEEDCRRMCRDCELGFELVMEDGKYFHILAYTNKAGESVTAKYRPICAASPMREGSGK